MGLKCLLLSKNTFQNFKNITQTNNEQTCVKNVFNSFMRKLDRQFGETGSKNVCIIQYLQSLKKDYWNEKASQNIKLLIISVK